MAECDCADVYYLYSLSRWTSDRLDQLLPLMQGSGTVEAGFLHCYLQSLIKTVWRDVDEVSRRERQGRRHTPAGFLPCRTLARQRCRTAETEQPPLTRLSRESKKAVKKAVQLLVGLPANATLA